MNATHIIKQYLTENGIKQSFVAEKAGMSPELFRRSLEGTRKLQADEFLAICGVLALDFDRFREGGQCPRESQGQRVS